MSTVNFRNFIAVNRIPLGQIQELVARCQASGDKFAKTEIIVAGQKRFMKAVRGNPEGGILLTLDNDYN